MLGTNLTNKYKAITLASQANSPKVNRLIGRSRILIKGTKIILAIINMTVALARSNGLLPIEKDGIIFEVRINAIRLIKKLRRIVFTVLSYTKTDFFLNFR